MQPEALPVMPEMEQPVSLDTLAGFDGRYGLIVFDHECIFCSSFVRFVFARDRDAFFRFTSAQGPIGQRLYQHYGLDPVDFSTNLVIINGQLFSKLEGFAEVVRRFAFPGSLLSAVGRLPRWLGEPVYDLIAKNRYRIFGRYETCMMPSPGLKARIID